MGKKIYCAAGEATDDNMARAHFLPDKQGKNTNTDS